MVPAVATVGYPSYWPTDGRDGGAPDPATAGPPIIQIGTEGGFLPAPVVIPSTPINYNYNRRDIVVLNISTHGLLLGPAERADIIVDFSGVPAGSKLILYSDAPAPVPAFDPRYDFYTGGPDLTSMGGVPPTQPGYGPNTRTIMQFQVTAGGAGGFSLGALQAALPTAFAVSQPAPLVPESGYGPAYGTTYQDNYVRIQDTTFTFAPNATASPTTVDLKSKAIQELFDPDYGRMNAILGLEIPLTNFTNQTTIPYYYIDPPSEIIKNGDTQYWKITHNGVDTHAIHFHLFNVQLINRVGWDGAIRPPDPNELGWKDTVRMNPLEDAIVALRSIQPLVPFTIPNSIRPLNPAAAIGSTMGFANIDPTGNPSPVTNVMTNFGWEYVWHCHLLGHEENDMMRPMIFAVPPNAPTYLTALVLSGPTRAQLNWTSTSNTETGFTIQRATGITFPVTGLVTFNVGPGITTYIDSTIAESTTYFYRVQANTLVGAGVALPAYPMDSADSAFSNIAGIGPQAFLIRIVDFNGDNREDILWRNYVTGQNVVWYLGGYTTAGQTPVGPATTGTSFQSLTALDMNHGRAPKVCRDVTDIGGFRDTKAGIVAFEPISQPGNGDLHMAQAQMTAARGLVFSSPALGLRAQGQNVIGDGYLTTISDINWQIVGTGDFDRDGKIDILWRHATSGQNVVWYMNGIVNTGYSFLPAAADPNWKIVGTGDFNNDGSVDILWRNSSDGKNVVWFMTGTTYTGYAYLDTVTDQSWQIVGTGDFNNDGNVDILWRNSMTGQNVVWFMTGTTYTSYAYLPVVTDLNWQIVGTGNYNGDGNVDILWRNISTGQIAVWYMNGTTYAGYDYLPRTVTDLNWKIVNR